MGRKCAISVCLSDSNRDADRGVTFHKIPMHPDIRPKWMSLCRIPEDKKLMKVIYVCSRHFLNADFCNFKGKKYMLKQGVLPSVFPWSKQSKTEQTAPLSGIEPEIKLEEGDSELAVNSSFDETEEPEVKIEIPESQLHDFNATLSIKTEDTTVNMNKQEILSPHQSTTIEQKVKTIDTTTGPLTFAPNTRIEALDFNQSWCPARILEVDYQENEVLVHFDKYSSKYDEWICMNSSTLRALTPVVQQQSSPKNTTLYEVGERCLASWSDSRKFPATVAKVLEKDSYEVHFDDGFTKILKSHRMAKASGKPMQLSPLFNPARGSKQERRDRKRKLNVASLFGKRGRAGSQEDRNASSTDLDDSEYWTPKWENGRPVGENSVIEMHDGPKKSIIVPDPRLPPHWVKHMTQRTHGASCGKWDTIIVNPEGRRFRMRNEIKSYIEDHPEQNLSESMFNFALHRRSKKSSESRKSLPSETIVHDPAAETLTEEESSPYNLNSLKIPLVDNGYKCPIEGCGKNFRRENLAQMHVKHYHPEYTKYLDSTPNVADLAYARTVGDSLDRSPGPEKPVRTVHPKPVPKTVAPKVVPHESDSQNSLFKVRDSEIIKLLSSKPNEHRPDGPISPILPSGLPPSMYPDIKLKDLLTESEAIPKRDDLNLKALSAHRPTGYKTVAPRDDFDEPSSSKGRPVNAKRKKVFPEQLEPIVKKEEGLFMSFEPTQVVEQVNPTNNVIIEGGEVIKIVQMKREEIINCTCGITEEDGLMIQCELCLCWQHAYCNNIQRESEVPEKYVCYICQNPMRQRSSKKYFHDQDWLKHGTLAVGNYHCKDEALLKERFEKLKKSHDLSGGLLEVKDYLHTLRVKIKIAMDKNHPKSYLWSKPWEKQPLPEKMEIETDEKPELPDGQIKSEENDSMLLTLLKSKDIPTEPADFPKLDLNTLIGNNMENIPAMQAPRIPEPEAAIDSADCRLNLLEHIAHSQSLVEERLAYFDEQIDKLEGALDDEENEDDYPKLRQTTRMLMRDLTVLKELSQMNTF